jgi:hypothetical protein
MSLAEPPVIGRDAVWIDDGDGVAVVWPGFMLVSDGRFPRVGVSDGRDVTVTSGVDVRLPAILLMAPQPKRGRQKKSSTATLIRLDVSHLRKRNETKNRTDETSFPILSSHQLAVELRENRTDA